MNGQNLKINLIPFTPVKEKVELAFFKNQDNGAFPLHLSEAPLEIAETYSVQDRKRNPHVYTHFAAHSNADFTASVDITKSIRFAKHYFSHIIREYFKNRADIISNNFISDVEVWFKMPANTERGANPAFTTYHVYSLRVQYAQVSKGYELVIYDNGSTRVLNTSLADLHDVDSRVFTSVVYKNNLFSYAELPLQARNNFKEVYPIVNNELAAQLSLGTADIPSKDKYIRLWESLNGFVNDHINNDEFQSLINTGLGAFFTVPADKALSTRKSSSFLQIGLEEEKTLVYSPKDTLKEHGPYSLPQKSDVKFIMIFHENDRDYANRLVNIFRKRYQKPDGSFMDDKFGTSLYEFIRIKFDLDKQNSIQFKDEMAPFDEIHKFLDNNSLDTENYTYVAIYLSPFKKDDPDKAKKEVYYKVKKTLLNHGITSQAIYKEHVLKKDFRNFYYINIAAAILAKSGGIPWKLDAVSKDELVVGVGAFKSEELKTRYIGSAFCFSNNGEFEEFNCVSEAETFLLAQEIKIMIQNFLKKKQKLDRVVIHFYKAMSKKEIEPIKKVLFQLGYPDVPIVIITINKSLSKDYLVFDTNFRELIPISGTIIYLGRDKYLLFNNTRYLGQDDAKIESYHLPLKLTFQSTHKDALKDIAVKKELIDQVYQFSRMYWKSVKQQNLPVTVKYPEMVARIYPYFEMDDLNEFGRSNLWFL